MKQRFQVLGALGTITAFAVVAIGIPLLGCHLDAIELAPQSAAITTILKPESEPWIEIAQPPGPPPSATVCWEGYQHSFLHNQKNAKPEQGAFMCLDCNGKGFVATVASDE